ncbi:MAG: DUF2796 domain-containing protein [Methyloligellaceae bacterium]
MQKLCLTLLCCFLLGTDASAEDKHRAVGAHVHGHGSLNIAIEGNTVTMELEAPGADIVGFEHAAKTDAQKAALKTAKEALESPLKLFVFSPEAGCSQKTAKVMLETEHEAKESEHAHEHEKKSGKHAKDKASEESEGTHAEFHAEYQLSCKTPKALTSITFAYFDQFKGAEELDVNVITAKGQRQYEVERDEPRIALQGMM